MKGGKALFGSSEPQNTSIFFAISKSSFLLWELASTRGRPHSVGGPCYVRYRHVAFLEYVYFEYTVNTIYP